MVKCCEKQSELAKQDHIYPLFQHVSLIGNGSSPHRWILIAFILSITVGTPLSTLGQEPINWLTLQEISYATQKIEGSNYPVSLPQFSEEVMVLEGKWVEITGFAIPIDTEGREYVLSAFPYANCFFCGGAGRESVIQLQLNPGQGPYRLDQRITVKGKLSLRYDPYDLLYVLEMAQAQE